MGILILLHRRVGNFYICEGKHIWSPHVVKTMWDFEVFDLLKVDKAPKVDFY